MRKKFFALTALLASSLAMSLPSSPVKAAKLAEQPEMIAHAVVAPTSPQTTGPSSQPLPWGLDRIDQRSNTLDNSYSFSGNGAGVKVYVVDSGVNATHSEFGGTSRVVDGWSYRADNRASFTSVPNTDPSYYFNSNVSYHNARLANNIPACASNPTTQTYVPSTFDDRVSAANADTTDKGKEDNDGHGTHVAGTIGGEFTGVAKAVTIVPVRVLDSCGAGTTTMVHNGLRWILNQHIPGQPAVINMSIGFDSSASTIDNDIRALLLAGIVVVAAAGNDAGSSCNTTPAGTAGTISVGAIDNVGAESWYSNFGECVDVFAPGSNILSTWPKNGVSTNTYYLETGTSMAAPHVAGAAALRLQVLQSQGIATTSSTPTDIWNWIKGNANCEVVTYRNSALPLTSQTSNRVLNIGSAAGPACAPLSATAIAGDRTATITWTESIGSNGSPLTGYTAVASPGGQSCASDAVTLTCVISGLTNNVAYSVSVKGVNAVGSGVAAATTSLFTPVGAPLAVASVTAVATNKSLVVSWAPAAGDGPGITYTATATPGGASCTTTDVTCTLVGLTNGKNYSVSVIGTNAVGSAASLVPVSARPGFKVFITSVKKKSKTTLTKIVTSVSTGKKTWSESGPCSISAGKLVAPTKAGTCKLTLKVAKSATYPAMSTTVSVAVK